MICRHLAYLCSGRGLKLPLVLVFIAGVAAVALAGTAAGNDEGSPEDRQFFADLEHLTSHPHRLPGSTYGQQTADYIEQRLKEAGITDVFRYYMQVPYLSADRCEMVIGDETVPLSPMRPNISVPPATPEDGISGPIFYVGRGEMEDYDNRSPENGIVLMDYDSYDNWQRAFELGAKAVIFLGDGDEAPTHPMHAPVPANLIRLYADRNDVEDVLGLDGTRAEATVYSNLSWQYRWDANIIARVPGTDPALEALDEPPTSGPEALVLSVAYDSFGEVPHRSPGARRAANIAALLQTAETFINEPPARDIIFMFFGGRSYNHQGAREIYDALLMDQGTHNDMMDEHDDELRTVDTAYGLLQDEGILFPDDADGSDVLQRILREQSRFVRDNIGFDLQMLRMQHLDEAERDDEFKRREERKQNLALQWDVIRRAIYERRLDELFERREQYARGIFETDESRMWGDERRARARENAVKQGQLLEELEEAVTVHLQSRLGELSERVRRDEQRLALRKGLFGTEESSEVIRDYRGIVLHVSFELSDGGPEWGMVPLHQYHLLFGRSLPGDGDNPGYYARVLRALGEAAEGAGDLPGLSRRALREPLYGRTFVPGLLVHEGQVAGGYGLYNVALVTGFDRRARDGHPSDSLEHLDGRRILEQSRHAAVLLRHLADGRAISLPRLFGSQNESKYPGWRGNRVRGERATRRVTGGLAEMQPAVGALMAVWPGTRDWQNLKESGALPDFSPFSFERTDSTGRFRILGARTDLGNEHMLLGMSFDGTGRVGAITSRHSIQSDIVAATGRPVLFPVARPGSVIASRPIHRNRGRMRLIRGTTDGVFLEEHFLAGTLDSFTFAYISAQNVREKFKFFQVLGPVLLGEPTDRHPFGAGVDPSWLLHPPRINAHTYNELWRLNEHRLQTMRGRGITRPDLETLHNTARAVGMQIDQAGKLAEQESLSQSSASLSHRLYGPLLSSMHDLVHAIVFLLVLSIPFAFAMERLVVCATSIHGRIGGFVVMFLATFALLYWMHPGFAISSTPIIIFLAFAILLLSSLVIYLLIRKFDGELKALQGQSLAMHDVQVSRTGTMMAAVGMGMSTMRRRPTRTILTAITVVALTFTILCFASFARHVGVRSVYEGPIGENMPTGVLARHLDFTPLPSAVPDLLERHAEDGGLLAIHWWMGRMHEDDPPLTAANPRTGASVDIGAVLGVPPAELRRWPALAASLDGGDVDERAEKLEHGQVYLPVIMAELLGLETGDTFLLHGQPVGLGGTIHSANLQLLRNIDNMPVTPVDFRELDPVEMEDDDREEETGGGLIRTEVQRSFRRTAVEQVVVGSSDMVRRMGGAPHTVTLYPAEDVDLIDKGREFSRILSMPVWAAGPEGIERMILTFLTELAGGFALGVPLLLGGLIIFGTLLSSITDREREIYTFSALGLSPGHVGLLFFAEAAVYAVVGGMGGQLLAQLVALGASALAERGIIQPVSINFSSTHSLFAIGMVMLVVMVSAIYPAIRASRSANPGLVRSWKMPAPEGDNLKMIFPFTVSAYDITGVVSFLAEHFRSHDDAGLGAFAASDVGILRDEDSNLVLTADLALAPFDLGVTQHFVLTAVPSEIEGVDEVEIRITRKSGATNDWIRGNRVFLRDLRVQFLVWRTLSEEAVENYRITTLQTLGEDIPPDEGDGFE